MKIDLKIGPSRASNILMPSTKKTANVLYQTPLRADVRLSGGKLTDNLFPNFVHEFSEVIRLDIPGATIIMPVIRPRLLGDLGSTTLGTMTNWTLEDFYYVEELTEVRNG